MGKPRKHYITEFKVEVLREHPENQIPIGKLTEKYLIQPNLLNMWKKEFFENELQYSNRKKEAKPNRKR